MRKFSSPTSLINFLLLIGILILPFCGLLAYSQIQQLIRANEWVIHTEKVMNVANYVLLNLTDAESRVNYYLLSNDKTSLGEVNHLILAAKNNMKLLKNLTRDNPIQTIRVNDLEKLLVQKVNLIQQLTQLNDIKKDQNGFALATSQTRKELNQNIIKGVMELNQEELNLLEQRNNFVLEEINRSHLIFFVFGGISELLIILSFILLNYYQYYRSIAERKQKEAEQELLLSNKKLQESDERYLLATEGSSAGLWDWKVGSNKLFYSPYFKRMLDYSDEEFPPTLESFEKVLHPADHDKVWQSINEHLKHRTPFKIEYRLRSKSGEYKWIEAAGQALWDQNGIPTRMSGSIIDITERKKAEQRLWIQYAITEILAEATSLADCSVSIVKVICEGLGWQFGIIWTINHSRTLLSCMGTWHEPSPLLKDLVKATCSTHVHCGIDLAGIAWKEGKGIWFSDISKYPDYKHMTLANELGLKSAFAFPIMLHKKILGVIECFTLEYEPPDKRILSLAANVGSQIGQFVSRKQSEIELRSSETYQAAILQAATDSIITINAVNNIVSFNAQTLKEFNYLDNELENINIAVLIPVMAKKKAEYEQDLKAEQIGIRKNGETFPIEIKLSEMTINDESYTVVNIRNITDRKKGEKVKNEFVSVVSHELRTPLTSIRGALALIADGTTGSYSEEMGALLTLAKNNSDRLLAIINDILDIDKIESGTMGFQFEIVNLREIVKESIEVNKMYADKYQISLKILGSAQPKVKVDPNRLLQVLTNLISNAVKFSPPGETVRLAINSENNEACVAIVNKGEGIPIQFQPYIFQKFSQADTSDTRGKGGTGLGLSISKAIIEKLGGSLNFVSEPNVETTFYFKLPIWVGGPNDEKPAKKVSQAVVNSTKV